MVRIGVDGVISHVHCTLPLLKSKPCGLQRGYHNIVFPYFVEWPFENLVYFNRYVNLPIRCRVDFKSSPHPLYAKAANDFNRTEGWSAAVLPWTLHGLEKLLSKKRHSVNRVSCGLISSYRESRAQAAQAAQDTHRAVAAQWSHLTSLSQKAQNTIIT